MIFCCGRPSQLGHCIAEIYVDSDSILFWCLLLLLLSRFRRVRLCETPQTAAHQAPPSLGFSRQEHWEWIAVSFSNAWKWKVKVKSLSPVWLLKPHGLQPTRLLHPWDFPGKSTGVGRHCLLWLLIFMVVIIMSDSECYCTHQRWLWLYTCLVKCCASIKGWYSIPPIYLWHRTTRECQLSFLQGKERCIFLLGCRYKHFSRAYPDLHLANQPILLCFLKLIM